jgi:membrane protein YqaA with SNARE-associated domain
MDLIEAYSYLFTDSLVTAILFVPSEELVIDVMRIFGSYDNYLIFLLAAVGSTVGSCANWVFGTFLRKCVNREPFKDREKPLAHAEKLFKKHGKWSLLFSFVPLWGGLLTTAAGTLRSNFLEFLTLVTIGKFLFYGVKIFL